MGADGGPMGADGGPMGARWGGAGKLVRWRVGLGLDRVVTLRTTTRSDKVVIARTGFYLGTANCTAQPTTTEILALGSDWTRLQVSGQRTSFWGSTGSS